MRKDGQHTKVGLVQINNSFSGQNYLPYSVGILQAYAQVHLTNPSAFEFMLPIYSRLPVGEAVDRLAGADVVFFSVYVWNFRISTAIAAAFKKEYPSVPVIFGGPHVPDRVEAFARQHPYVDICCHGEGEQVITTLLQNLDPGDWDKVPSITFRRPDGTLVHTPKAERLKDLSVVPSPYLSGVFDPLMKANPQEKWIVMWETNRGCPFQCTFCDWGSATQARIYNFAEERLYKELEWFAQHKIEFIFCADANFGLMPRDLEIAREAAATKRKYGYPHALSVQNTKNATERAYQVQKTLADAGLNKGVTISFQSVDAMTLASIKRANISTRSFQELQRRFTRDRIETYSDLILGLPGETYESFTKGTSDVIANGQHNRIQFNNLSILPNAEMGDPAYQKKYGMITVTSKVINIHGSLEESPDEIHELQELVIATDAMPKDDWLKTRAFGWMAALLHFDKILQIPLVLIHELTGVSYKELIESFMHGLGGDTPILEEINAFFMEKARDIQNGGPEYCRSEEYLNIWWPADELMFIRLCTENKLASFYQEAEIVLNRVVASAGKTIDRVALHEAIHLNHAFVKQPFQTEDLRVDLTHNVWNFYRSVLWGEPTVLAKTSISHFIDRTSQRWNSWADWCREVVWWGNKKGAYLYSQRSDNKELAGHF